MSRDFTPDGQMIYEIIDDFDKSHRTGRFAKKTNAGGDDNQPPKDGKFKKELDFTKMELVKMIVNSQMVVEDCDTILSELQTAEDYIKSDARVAKRLHLGLIDRLTRILMGEAAFENEEHLTLTIDQLKAAMASKKT